jgi:hypothetical protein
MVDENGETASDRVRQSLVKSPQFCRSPPGGQGHLADPQGDDSITTSMVFMMVDVALGAAAHMAEALVHRPRLFELREEGRRIDPRAGRPEGLADC